jgi:hypothetical protein
MGATPVTAQFQALSDDRQQAFVAHVVERIANYVDDAGLAVLSGDFARANRRAHDRHPGIRP